MAIAIAVHGVMPLLAGLTPALGSLDVEGDSFCDLLKPRADVPNPIARLALRGERKENGLGRVFGVVRVFGGSETDAEHHAGVSTDDLLERDLVPGGLELGQELPCVRYGS
jgi:hypothetical protein